MTLEETQFVEVNHHLLQEKANQCAVYGDLVATAKNLYHFVRDNIRYQDYSNTRKGAVRTLQEGCGNCCDQAHLLVGLFRTAKIPAFYAHGDNHWWAVACIDRQYHCDPTNRKHSFGNPQHGNKHRNPTLHASLNH